jgi:hypothetical protein
MKNKFAALILCAFLPLFAGCRSARINDIPPAGTMSPPIVAADHHTPATVAAKISPVAAAVAKTVYLLYAVGVCALIAGGVLIYFGQLIPGAKCVVAGFILPIAATWLNYHYAAVIAAVLIGSAGGFLWAFARHNPAAVAGLRRFFVNGYAKVEKEIADPAHSAGIFGR